MNDLTNTEQMLQELLAEVQAVDPEMLPPASPREDGDDLLCRLDDTYLRKLFTLGITYSREHSRQMLDAQYEADNDKLRFSAKVSEYKARFLFNLLWYLVRQKYDLWAPNTIMVRKGWQLVVPTDRSGPEGFIRQIFGGGQ